MSRVRWILGVAALVLALAALAVAPASARSHHAAAVACGDVISVDTALMKNLTCAGDGLTVTNGALLDLNGHSLRGNGTGVGVTVGRPTDPTVAGIVLTNGTITGFRTGVDVHTASARVEDLVVKNNVGPGVLVSQLTGEHGTIQRNKIVANDQGILLAHRAGRNSQILENTINRNTGDGIHVTFENDGITYQDNVISQNGGYGITVLSSVSKIIHNRLNGNSLDGLLAVEEVPELAPLWLIADNRANNNGGHGLDVTAGIPDGGGNRAVSNATEPQCVNIAC
jgi:hypothetical protein